MTTEGEALGYARFWFGSLCDLPVLPEVYSPRSLWRKKRIAWDVAAFLDACRIKPSQALCDRYWAEIDKGQDIREDAGGYHWRAWLVALGIRQPGEVLTQEMVERVMHQDSVDAMLKVLDSGKSPLAHLPPAICIICGDEPISKGRTWIAEGLCSACDGLK